MQQQVLETSSGSPFTTLLCLALKVGGPGRGSFLEKPKEARVAPDVRAWAVCGRLRPGQCPVGSLHRCAVPEPIRTGRQIGVVAQQTYGAQWDFTDCGTFLMMRLTCGVRQMWQVELLLREAMIHVVQVTPC